MKTTENLVNEVLSGKMEAFEELYHLTSKQVYFTCYSFVKNEQDTLDLMQETYLAAMTHLSSLKEAERFPQWISQIAANKCRDYFTKKKPLPLDEEIINNIPVSDDELTLPEKYITDQAKRKILMDIMSEKLSMAQYQTVVLYYFDGLSQQEIAECMNCPEGTVSYRLSVARSKIKEGVLAYEKKSGEKLYCVAGIPFLTAFFVAQAEGLVVPDVLAGILSAFSAGGSATAKTASCVVAKNATKAVSSKTTKEVVKKTGLAAIKHSRLFKITAGIALLALIGGGITVMIKNSKPETQYVYESDVISVEYISSSYVPNPEFPNGNGNIDLTLNITNKTDKELTLDQFYACVNRLSTSAGVPFTPLQPGSQEVMFSIPVSNLKDVGPIEITNTDIVMIFMNQENPRNGETGEKACFNVNFHEPIAFDAVPIYPYEECQIVCDDTNFTLYSTLKFTECDGLYNYTEMGYIESHIADCTKLHYCCDEMKDRDYRDENYQFIFPDSYAPIIFRGYGYETLPESIEIRAILHFYDPINSTNYVGYYVTSAEDYFEYTIYKEEE